MFPFTLVFRVNGLHLSINRLDGSRIVFGGSFKVGRKISFLLRERRFLLRQSFRPFLRMSCRLSSFLKAFVLKFLLWWPGFGGVTKRMGEEYTG